METCCYHDNTTNKQYQYVASCWQRGEDPTSRKYSRNTTLGLRSVTINRAVTFTYTHTASSPLREAHNALQIVPSRPTCYVIQIAVLFQISAQGSSRFLKHIGNITVHPRLANWFLFATKLLLIQCQLLDTSGCFKLVLDSSPHIRTCRKQFVTGSATFTFSHIKLCN